jgi:predicted secreted Zn-dependent protease
MTLVLGPTVNETYDVTASTLSDVVDILSGRDEAGHCHWEIKYTYDSAGRDGKPVGLVVEATIKIEMPVWVGRDSARAAERTEWDRFRRALRDHEDGHDTRARTGIQALHDKLEDTRTGRLSRVYAAEKARIQRESNAYDHATNHGRRPAPGTIITIPARPRP